MNEQDYEAFRRLGPSADEDLSVSSAPRRCESARRNAGLHQVRQISAWVAAAAIAGTAGGAGYFVRATATPAGPAPGRTAAAQGGAQGIVQGGSQRPNLSHPVVTSGGSGVTAGGTTSRAGSGAVTWRDN
jgi:hypothetical protein